LKSGKKCYSRAVQQCDQWLSALDDGKPVELNRDVGLLTQFIEMFYRDPSLAVLAMQIKKSNEEDYLFRHCVNVAVLAMTLALYMGFDREQVIEAGLGALFHDMGMLKVSDSIRLAPPPLAYRRRNVGDP